MGTTAPNEAPALYSASRDVIVKAFTLWIEDAREGRTEWVGHSDTDAAAGKAADHFIELVSGLQSVSANVTADQCRAMDDTGSIATSLNEVAA